MSASLIVSALVACCRCSASSRALLYLDSYKLVKLRTVIAVVACGAVVAGGGFFLNAWLLGVLGIELTSYMRYVGPCIEELLKGLVIVVLIRLHRIGFLVDAAIFGFAVGSGFAVIENLYYLEQVPDAGMGTWIVRGFGTAIMHGGATAIFAVMSLRALERTQRADLWSFLPGFALAVGLHAAYNHLFLSPKLSTLGMIVVMPPLFYLVFERSARAVGNWLGRGFDADTEMLDLINSGRLSDSPIGRIPAHAEGQVQRRGARRHPVLSSPLYGARAPRQGHPDDARKRLRGRTSTTRLEPSSTRCDIWSEASAARG